MQSTAMQSLRGRCCSLEGRRCAERTMLLLAALRVCVVSLWLLSGGVNAETISTVRKDARTIIKDYTLEALKSPEPLNYPNLARIVSETMFKKYAIYSSSGDGPEGRSRTFYLLSWTFVMVYAGPHEEDTGVALNPFCNVEQPPIDQCSAGGAIMEYLPGGETFRAKAWVLFWVPEYEHKKPLKPETNEAINYILYYCAATKKMATQGGVHPPTVAKCLGEKLHEGRQEPTRGVLVLEANDLLGFAAPGGRVYTNQDIDSKFFNARSHKLEDGPQLMVAMLLPPDA